MSPDLEPVAPARIEWRNGAPYSPAYGDCYFGADDALAESRAVFIDGSFLRPRFESLRAGQQFSLGEVGFGSGLNLLAAAKLFARHAAAGARLCLISVEKHPLTRADLHSALLRWPGLGPLAGQLQAQYPAATPGFHRLRLADNIDLTLMLGDALTLWCQYDGSIDAWFLDGFAPARNPQLWQKPLFERMAELSRPGTTLASFSVAGAVRRGLAECGFQVRRKPGFGNKRQRLEGSIEGTWRAREFIQGTACIVGAGLAGASTARALAERGWQVEVRDRLGIAGGASGNPAGVVYTSPSGAATPQNRFYQSSYLHALRRLGRWQRETGRPTRDCCRLEGVVQHIVSPRHRAKLFAAMSSGHWTDELLSLEDDDAVVLHGAGYLDPRAWCHALLDHPRIRFRPGSLDSSQAGPGFVFEDRSRAAADVTVICMAGAAAGLAGMPRLLLKHVRGQITFCRATAASAGWQRARCFTGYLTPSIHGQHCIGATYDPRDGDPHPRATDDLGNLAMLRSWLPKRWRELGGRDIEVTGRRVAFRCQAIDFLPLAGAVGSINDACPTYLNIGHGSRGIAGTPLVAELLADTISRLGPPMDRAMRQALSPTRFCKSSRQASPNG
ncbi:MAG: FAD-dependent 5-carboxymethylaminomethyl-2-thiouridine(34) oxidoreductase MnmC [Xanthomonadaceae bacterium]|nr:FAD-dependent 5-carboxymethylaminomethyl-2-thiouridine(34) oxidoreductase MnmC [Xanthomonadaceae bacterium]